MPALLSSERGAPPAETLRRAPYNCAPVKPVRAARPPPADVAAAIRWVERNTVSLADFQDPTRGPALVRRALDTLALRIDGKSAAPNTLARKRAVFYHGLEYAVEIGLRKVITTVASQGPTGARGLKHRAANEIRLVPAHPELACLLRHHLKEFGTGQHGPCSLAGTAGDPANRRTCRSGVGLGS